MSTSSADPGSAPPAGAASAPVVDGSASPGVRRGFRRVLPWVAFLVLALGASWPWIATLSYPPMAVDTQPWLERSDPADPDWLGFVLDTRHFRVGYRPLTALTFSLDAWAFGDAALGLRGTDLALHLLALAGVFALARALLPGRTGWALVALLLFALHPSVEEVAPFSARRSYSLGVGLSLLGVALAASAARRAPSGARRILPGLLAGLLLACGVLSNEVAGVAVGGALLLAWAADPRPEGRARRALALGLPLALPVAAALLLRSRVVEGLGGYRLQEGEGAPWGDILAACWSDTLALAPPFLALALGATGLVLGLLHGVKRLVHGTPGSGAAVDLALLVWLATYGLLYSGQGVWYGRQALPVAAVLALVLTRAMAGTTSAAGVVEGHPLSGPARLPRIVAGVACVPLLLAAPPLRGPDPQRTAVWAQRRDLIEALLAIPAQVQAPAQVRLVLPFHRGADEEGSELHAAAVNMQLPRDARQPARWAQHVLGEDAVLLTEYAYVEEERARFEAPVGVELVDGQTRLRLPVDREVLLIDISRPKLRDPALGPLQPLPRAGRERDRTQYLFLYDVRGGRVEAVQRGGRGG